MFRFNSPATLGQWIVRLDQVVLPVLQRSIDGLVSLREHEDETDPQSLCPIVLADPFLTVKVLSHVARHRSRRVEGEVLTVNSAVLLMGVGPMLRHLEDLTPVETLLADLPFARQGIENVLARSYRAARLALGYAVHRGDVEAELLHEAALLHDFAELLVWVHAPALAAALQQEAHGETGRSREALERRILGVTLNELEQAALQRWHMPTGLSRVTDAREAANPRARTVMMAARVALHTEEGWGLPCLQEDFLELGDLLGITPLVAQRKSVEWLGETG